MLALVLLKTGRGALVWAMAGAAVVFALLLLLELAIVTDKERVEATLSTAAAALEQNNVDGLMAVIASDAGGMRSRVASEMDRFQITEASFRRLEVTFNRYTNPPTAEAKFIGTIKVKDRRGEFPYENFVHPFTVFLRKDGDRWLMTGYDDNDIRGGGSGKPKR